MWTHTVVCQLFSSCLVSPVFRVSQSQLAVEVPAKAFEATVIEEGTPSIGTDQ